MRSPIGFTRRVLGVGLRAFGTTSLLTSQSEFCICPRMLMKSGLP
jgi:hypothetical protein